MAAGGDGADGEVTAAEAGTACEPVRYDARMGQNLRIFYRER